MLRDAKLKENLFKPKVPEYTIRMLLSNVKAESKEIPKLKSFTHFTLGCTYADEHLKVTTAFEKLADIFKDSVTFKAEKVVNLGSEAQPLWGVGLSLGSNEKTIRNYFSDLFDSIMCPERNGILYLWQSKDESQIRYPHLTIGPRREDLEIAKNLLELNCEFIFNQIDYKKVGPHDPHITTNLEKPHNNAINLEPK